MAEQNSSPENKAEVPSTPPGGRFKKPSRRKMLVGLALILVLAAGVGAYVYTQIIKDEVKPVSTRPYSFDEEQGARFVAEHLLEGEKDGTSFSFDIPIAEFLYPEDSYKEAGRQPDSYGDGIHKFLDKGNRVELGQRIFSANSNRVFHQSIIAALIVPPEQQPEFNMVDYFKAGISTIVFVNGNHQAYVSLGLKNQKEFTNANIKAGGQLFEFDAVSTNTLYEEQPVKRIKGYIVEVKGKNANYYLMIGAIEDVFNSSTGSWQKTLDSLQVDL